VSDGGLVPLDEVLLESPASARLIDPGDLDCESLVEGTVADEVSVDELVRGGTAEELYGGVPEELEEDVEEPGADVDGYLPGAGPEGFEPDVDGFELEVAEFELDVDELAGGVEASVDEGDVVEGELLDCEPVDGLVCVDELLCREELVAPLLEAPVDVELDVPLDVCA
jgi:hypothetical protein